MTELVFDRVAALASDAGDVPLRLDQVDDLNVVVERVERARFVCPEIRLSPYLELLLLRKDRMK